MGASDVWQFSILDPILGLILECMLYECIGIDRAWQPHSCDHGYVAESLPVNHCQRDIRYLLTLGYIAIKRIVYIHQSDRMNLF